MACNVPWVYAANMLACQVGIQDRSRLYLDVLQELSPTTICATEVVHDVLSPVNVGRNGRIKFGEVLILFVAWFP